MPLRRAVPEIGAVVTVTYRRTSPMLGFGADGLARTEPVTLCRMRVLAVREALLQDVTPAQATAEGYRSRSELLREWGDPDEPVRVRVLDIEAIHADEPRFMSSRVIAGKQGDYVSVRERAIDDVECVDDDTLETFTREARKRELERRLLHHDERAALSFDDQLRLLTEEARARHIDIRNEVRAIKRWSDTVARQHQLEAIRAKLERPVSAAA